VDPAFLEHLRSQLAEITDQGLYKRERVISTPQGPWVQADGRRVINLCANNYLGLANHPDVVEAAAAGLRSHGFGLSSVRFICGTQDIHTQLEARISDFLGTEATQLYSSCFDANGGVFEPLLGAEDAVVSDALNHASIIDGIRLCKARRYRYANCDMADLDRQLRQARADGARFVLVVTDGVFSMDGDIAPLDKIYDVTRQHDAILMVDDAHGEGVLGRGGRGIVDHFNLHGKVDIEVGTLSKAFGVVGGVVAGNRLVVEWLRQRGRPFLFSSAMTVPDVAACLAAVDLLEESTELVDRLWENANYFKAGMQALGFDTGESVTPITPVMLGDAQLAQDFSKILFQQGVFAMAIGYPTVPQGKARIRVMISAAHSRPDLDEALQVFANVGRQLEVIS